MPSSAPPLVDIGDMTAPAGFIVPNDLYTVLRAPALLAGMPRRCVGRMRELHAFGFRHVVRLEHDEEPYDPSPLSLAADLGLTDLWGNRIPDDQPNEFAMVASAVETVLGKLGRGEGVVVRCLGGTGRTGTVLGCALVKLGHDADDVLRYLTRIHAARSGMEWPESPWQSETVRSFASR